MELTKVCVEARDNVKFLTTLERHFKNLASGDLSLMHDTLGPMLSALCMVWIISRHYSNDQRMGSLLERIAGELQTQVKNQIDISSSHRGVFQVTSLRRSSNGPQRHAARARSLMGIA